MCASVVPLLTSDMIAARLKAVVDAVDALREEVVTQLGEDVPAQRDNQLNFANTVTALRSLSSEQAMSKDKLLRILYFISVIPFQVTASRSYWLAETADGRPIDEDTDGTWISQLVTANQLRPHYPLSPPASGSVLFYFVVKDGPRIAHSVLGKAKTLAALYGKVFFVWNSRETKRSSEADLPAILEIAVERNTWVDPNDGISFEPKLQRGRGVLNMAAATRLVSGAVAEARGTLQCANCGALAAQTCSRCMLAAYCSPSCQRQHWTMHALACHPE